MIFQPDELAELIAADTGQETETVRTILTLELEYMAMVGVAIPPLDYEFRWYTRDPDRLPEPAGPIAFVDTLVVARDCERLTGIPESIAHDVFLAELTLLEEWGLA